jgi:hypothetical protein
MPDVDVEGSGNIVAVLSRKHVAARSRLRRYVISVKVV